MVTKTICFFLAKIKNAHATRQEPGRTKPSQAAAKDVSGRAAGGHRPTVSGQGRSVVGEPPPLLVLQANRSLTGQHRTAPTGMPIAKLCRQ